jgi:predicted NAD/FAD-binding protein
MKVAIIGAGISGLTVAYNLRGVHDVALFEAGENAGGHADTVLVARRGAQVPIDTGFIVYNTTTYPGFSALLRELGVPTQPSDMSFGCSCLRCGIEYSSRGFSGVFADMRNLTRPSHWALLAGLRRFFRDGAELLADGTRADRTLGEYTDEIGAASSITGHYLLPMAAAIWSTPPAQVRDMPFDLFVRFLHNHGLIGWGRRLRWRTIAGGSRQYVRRLLAALPAGTLQAACPVGAVSRSGTWVTVTGGGRRRRFHAVVFACHADQALALLADAGEEEREALAAFRYATNRVVLHADGRLLPRHRRACASWNVTTADCRSPSPQLTMTYDMNRLQSLSAEGRGSYCVSVNPAGGLEPGRIIAERNFTHPLVTRESIAAQARIAVLQGRRSTYYAGAHLGYGFHEDGYQSGVRVADLLRKLP